MNQSKFLVLFNRFDFLQVGQKIEWLVFFSPSLCLCLSFSSSSSSSFHILLFLKRWLLGLSFAKPQRIMTHQKSFWQDGINAIDSWIRWWRSTGDDGSYALVSCTILKLELVRRFWGFAFSFLLYFIFMIFSLLSSSPHILYAFMDCVLSEWMLPYSFYLSKLTSSTPSLFHAVSIILFLLH